jgi:hypothetical protein
MKNRIFKIIQTYPGSPGLGYKVTFKPNYPYVSTAAGTFSLDDCLTYTKNWEEIIEPEYEILKFKTTTGEIVTLQNNGNYFNENSSAKFDPNGQYCGCSAEEEFDLGATIYSVKRLSDGEIFTVNDKINFSNVGVGNLIKIEFERAPADKNTGKLCFVNDNIFLGDWWDINQLSHIKKPLFTTSDGIDIFEGDKYWKVLPNSNYSKWELTAAETDASPKWTFSTEEGAKKYIDWNKPKYSKQDILNGWDDKEGGKTSRLFNNIIKQK